MIKFNEALLSRLIAGNRPITDTSLTHLEVISLLAEALQRIQDIQVGLDDNRRRYDLFVQNRDKEHAEIESERKAILARCKHELKSPRRSTDDGPYAICEICGAHLR